MDNDMTMTGVPFALVVPEDYFTGSEALASMFTLAGNEILRSALVAGAIALLRYVQAGSGENATP